MAAFGPFLEHFAQLVLDVPRLLGQLSHAARRQLFALVQPFAVLDAVATTRIGEYVSRVNAVARRRFFFDHDHHVNGLAAHGVADLFPSFAESVGHHWAFEHTGAKLGSVVDQLAQLAVVVALDQLVFDLGLHGFGFVGGVAHDRPSDHLHRHRIALLIRDGLAGHGVNGFLAVLY